MVTKAGGADLPAKGPGLGTAVRYVPPPKKNLYNTAISFMTKGCQQTTKPPHPHREWRQQNPASWGPCQGKAGL